MRTTRNRSPSIRKAMSIDVEISEDNKNASKAFTLHTRKKKTFLRIDLRESSDVFFFLSGLVMANVTYNRRDDE